MVYSARLLLPPCRLFALLPVYQQATVLIAQLGKAF